MYTTDSLHNVVSGGPHRAIVTYANDNSGEIRVRIPAVLGSSEITISLIGRKPDSTLSDGWAVPSVGDQIIVGTDDNTFTNVFWIQSDGTSKLKKRIAALEAQMEYILLTKDDWRR